MSSPLRAWCIMMRPMLHPLYLILAGRYLHYSGDVEFIRNNWDHIRKALDFCFSTDTDGDHLIENTLVGHGWEEGGGLFGTHSSLYLSSCWAEALEQSAFMAKAIGMEKGSGKNMLTKAKQYATSSIHHSGMLIPVISFMGSLRTAHL